MPQLTSFLQNADGDWDLTRGLRKCPDRATYVRQNLSVTLQFWEGEWFLDTREGIPYDRIVYGTKYDSRFLETLLREAALATRGVGSIEGITLRYDNPARKFYADLGAQTDTGDDVGGPFIVASAEQG